MKKVSVILAALLMTLGANAQDKPIKFGVKAGANLSSVSNIKVSGSGVEVAMLESDGMNVGFHAGGFLNYSFGQFFGIQPELLFSMQGGKQKPSAVVGLGNTSISYVFDYLNLPILFEIKPVSGLSLLVGPQFGVNIYRSLTAEGETISGSEFDSLLKDNLEIGSFKSLDVSIGMGVQYTFAKNILVGARYNLGVTPAVSLSEGGATVSGWKNNVLQLSIGYAF